MPASFRCRAALTRLPCRTTPGGNRPDRARSRQHEASGCQLQRSVIQIRQKPAGKSEIRPLLENFCHINPNRSDCRHKRQLAIRQAPKELANASAMMSRHILLFHNSCAGARSGSQSDMKLTHAAVKSLITVKGHAFNKESVPRNIGDYAAEICGPLKKSTDRQLSVACRNLAFQPLTRTYQNVKKCNQLV